MPQVGGLDTSLSEAGVPAASSDLLAPTVDITKPSAAVSTPDMPSAPGIDAPAVDVSTPDLSDVKTPEVDASLAAPTASGEASGTSASLPRLEGASGALGGASAKLPGAPGSIDPDAPKKKSRFSLPSFMSPSSRKSKKEGATGALALAVVPEILAWTCTAGA